MLTDSCLDQFVLQVFIEMYSMPNGEHDLVQDQEGEDSAEEAECPDSPEEEEGAKASSSEG